MLSFLHTPPSSPSEMMKNPSKSGSVSPEYIPIKRENWAVSSPESEIELKRKRRLESAEEQDRPNLKLLKLDTAAIDAANYKECSKMFDNPEDVVQALSLLKTRKNVDLKEYSREGTFIPNVLLALSQTPILSPEHSDKPPTVRPAPYPSARPVPHPTARTAPQHSSKPTKPKSEASRPYVCEYCGKQFTNIGNLATHARTHTKEKPYKCDKCDLMFAHTSNLQRHQLVHTGQRNNKCPHCSKCFSRSDYLKVHERTHTGEKPYACSVAGCSKRFLDSSSLKKHERTHTGDRPFACHICYKTYTESSKLKIHLQSHSAPKQCTKKPVVQKKQEPSFRGVPTVTLPNPFYSPALPPSLSYPSYHRLLPYSMAPTLARPTPTRPRAFYPHPYSRTVLSAPTRNSSSPLVPQVSNSSPRNSAFMPV